MGDSKLSAIFVEALGNALGSPDLDAVLTRLVDEARLAWPGVDVPTEAFVRALAERVGDSGPAELAELRGPELYVCIGCALGVPAALQSFEARYFPALAGIVRRTSAAVDVDELLQGLRESLYVGRDGTSAKILSYGGRGEIAGWLRVVTTRATLNAATRGPREQATDDDGLLSAAGEADSPELTYFRLHYDAEVKVALPLAFGALTPRQRLLLRQRYLDQLTVAELSRMHGVHAATIKRQLVEARDTLHDGLRATLQSRLGLSSSEFNSVLALIRTHFRITLARLLPARDPDP